MIRSNSKEKITIEVFVLIKCSVDFLSNLYKYIVGSMTDDLLESIIAWIHVHYASKYHNHIHVILYIILCTKLVCVDFVLRV